MRTKILLLTLSFCIQGCTVLGLAMDSKYPPKNEDYKGKSFSQIGAEVDVELVKSFIHDTPLAGNEPKKLTGCKELKGNKQVECYKVSNQLNESLQKHIKK